jgi:hypothetical protein
MLITKMNNYFEEIIYSRKKLKKENLGLFKMMNNKYNSIK